MRYAPSASKRQEKANSQTCVGANVASNPYEGFHDLRELEEFERSFGGMVTLAMTHCGDKSELESYEYHLFHVRDRITQIKATPAPD